ncbi:MAG: MltA domain-containing protein [Magnetococcales bacterium]|nr:MltA domain-containing protein [Magnetococcales bacterium]
MKRKSCFVVLLWFVGMLSLTACQTNPNAMAPGETETIRLGPGDTVPKAAASPQSLLEPVPWSEARDALVSDTSLSTWAAALMQSADYYQKQPPTTQFSFGTLQIDAATMARASRQLANAARSHKREDLEELLMANYQLFRSPGSDGHGNVLVTAYYEPLLHGSLQRTQTYRYPLYQRPNDLLEADLGDWYPDLKGKRLVARIDRGQLVPYHDRTDIDTHHRLDHRQLELVWVDNAIDAFFLQIQGSGRIQLDNGKILRVGYHAANGRPYRAIGKLLLEEKVFTKDEITLPVLKEWLRQHPEQVERVLAYNPSYVFFKVLNGPAVGNIAVPLTPGRSIATDHRLFPKGAPALLKTSLPALSPDGKTVREWRQEMRFVVNQDTGGAIVGPGRVDLFTGFGPEAESLAGIMKSEGSNLYFIAPKPLP